MFVGRGVWDHSQQRLSAGAGGLGVAGVGAVLVAVGAVWGVGTAAFLRAPKSTAGGRSEKEGRSSVIRAPVLWPLALLFYRQVGVVSCGVCVFVTENY